MGCYASSAKDKPHIEGTVVKKKANVKYNFKVLMVGTSASGKSTIAKQMKILHCNGHSPEEKENYKKILVSNVIFSLNQLIAFAQTNNIHLSCQLEAEKIGRIDFYNTPVLKELVDDIKKIWEDKGIQAAYSHYNELDIPANVEYCIANISRIFSPSCEITDEDILHARQRTTGMVEHEFKFGKYTWNLVDVGGQRAERRKWVHFYDNVVALIYIASLDEWDVLLPEDKTKTRMEESLEVFDSMINHEWFDHTPWILFLNKKDIFEKKLTTIDMRKTFPEYKGGVKYSKGVEFIKMMYLARIQNRSPEDVYVHVTCALDTQQINVVFGSVMEWIFRQRVQASGLS